MYRLIIADDEKIVRENIMKIVDFASCGFRVTACCENGLEVLEQAERECPDLVIADIQMPFMDGIKLAGELRRLSPMIQVVFLTGYNEFEYARQAVNLKVFDYLLKPISADKLQESLFEIKARLDEQKKQTQNLSRLRAHYETSMPLLRNAFLGELLTLSLSTERIESRARMLGMEFPADWEYSAAVIDIDPDSLPPADTPETTSIYHYAVYNIAEELSRDMAGVLPVFRGMETALIILRPPGESNADEVEGLLNHIRDITSRHLHFTVSVGLSGFRVSPRELRSCHGDAHTALGYRMAMGGNRLLYIQDFEPEQACCFPLFSSELEGRLVYTLKLGDKAGLEAVLDEIIARSRQEPYGAFALEVYYTSVFLCLIRVAVACGINDWEQAALWQVHPLPRDKGLEELAAFLKENSGELLLRIIEKRKNSCAVLARMAVDYIQAHYADPDLSVKTICTEFSISASYLGALFRREVDKSIGNYILEIRMAKAKELLSTTGMKNYEIAETCGYKDACYFSYTFKKFTGLSPNEMRKQLREA